MEFKKLQSYTFFIALAVASILFIWLVFPYLYPLFWAAVIATLFYPLQRWIHQRIGHTNITTSITLMIIIIVVVIPAGALIWLVLQQAIDLYQTYGQTYDLPWFQTTIQHYINWPPLQSWLEALNVEARLASATSSVSRVAYDVVTNTGQNAVRWIIELFIMLYALFYFLRDGDHFLKRLMHLLPLGDDNEQHLYDRFVSTVRATLKGTVVIGILQGSIGGIAFAIAGVPAAAFWGIVMVVLSIIPGVGASLVMLPGAVLLFLFGYTWQAIVVTCAMLIAGTIDNVIRGPLVGKDTQMHPLLIFLATIGGLVAFGASGFVMGPVITALALSLWDMYEHKYHSQLKHS